MNNTILIAIFAFLLIATIVSFITIYRNLKKQLEFSDKEKEALRLSYDQIRKEKIDLQDQLQLTQNQERTYKVAFEDWKSKYDMLELKYSGLKKESEPKNSSGTAITVSDSESSLSLNTGLNSSKKSPVDSSDHLHAELSHFTRELRQILDQHVEILNKIIGADPDLKWSTSPAKSDPLHWIMGIDEDTSGILKNQGIRTFEQLYELPKKDLKKLILQFDEIDERIIESWPMQAGAIIRSKQES